MPTTTKPQTSKDREFYSLNNFWFSFKHIFSVLKLAHDVSYSLKIDSKKETETLLKVDELTLSERDSRFLLSILENPPEPSSGLISVFD